ncbi:MAG: OmpA family protein [Proteobacteria bacterium]|nr:OmpA family protein [Pseudomonadota bacterium]
MRHFSLTRCAFLATVYFIGIFFLGIKPESVLAQPQIAKDVAGLKDPEGIKRMAGSLLVLGESKAFDEFVVALEQVVFDYNEQKFKEWKKLRLEGSRDTVFYRLPGDASTLEVSRSYRSDLEGAGYEMVREASASELDNGYGRFMKEVYGVNIGAQLMEYHLPASNDFRYLVMKRANNDGSESYVVGLFAKIRDVWGSRYAAPGEVVTRLDVLRTRPLKSRLVLVKAEEMPNLLDGAGKVVLYGVFFDTNQTTIKPESAETLQEVAKFLQDNPALKVIVTGHTDNVGTLEFNRDLSQRRAQAVIEYLHAKHNIAKTRLEPFGASFAAPVAPNSTEAGRAKNRRVELVPNS